MHTLKIRNYTSEDFEKYVLLRSRFCDVASLEEIAAGLCRPHFIPEKDLFLIEDKDRLVAFCEIIPEPQIGRVILDCFVHPDYRRKGLLSKLANPVSNRIAAMRAEKAQVNIPQNDQSTAKLLERYGFAPVRRHLEMQKDLSETDSYPTHECRYFQSGQEEDLGQLQNRCFAESWGYHPNTAESINYYLDLPGRGPQNVLLLYSHNEPVAYCWCKTDETSGQGRIYMLGVRPKHRRNELGKKVLLAGLSHLKNCGMTEACLTVDSQNKGALALYRSAGFEIADTSTWYEKQL